MNDAKIFEHKKAEAGKVLAKIIDGELCCTNAITSPLGMNLDDWLEFDNEDVAKAYYGITDKEENDLIAGADES